MMIFNTARLPSGFLFYFFVVVLISPSALANVAEYWHKISQKKSEDVHKIYQKRVANEGSTSKFIKQSTIYLCVSAEHYEWKKDIINDLLAKIDPKTFLNKEIKDSISSYVQRSQDEGRYLSLKSFLEEMLLKNENLKKSEPRKFEIALKLAQTDSALLLFSDAESVFLNSIGKKNIGLNFWYLYAYTDLLINMGKFDSVQEHIQKLVDLAKEKGQEEPKYLPWATLLESKLALQRNDVEKAYKKALEMKLAFEKLDLVRTNPDVHPYYVFSIIARRFNKLEEAMKGIDSAVKIASGKASLIEQLLYKLSRLKIRIKMGLHAEVDLLAELNSSFQLLEKTEVEELYKVYKTQYQKLIQKTLIRKDVELTFSKNLNYFENQEILSFLSEPI